MAREITRTREASAEVYYTRVASDGSLAYRVDEAARRAAQPAVRPEEERQSRPGKEGFSLPAFIRQSKFFPKLLAVVCIAAVASVAFFSVSRFALNTKIQSDINKIDKQIEQTESKIEELTINNRPVINAATYAEEYGLIPAKP